MGKSVEFVGKLGITYTTEGIVPVAAVTRSILANERLLAESIRLLEELVPGLRAKVQTTRVAHVSNESPLSEFLVSGILFTYQDELVEEVPDLITKLTGIEIPDSVDTLVTVMVLVVAVYLVREIITRTLPGKSVREIEREYRDKVERLSLASGLPARKIEEALEKRYGGQQSRTFTRRILDFFAPARNEPHAEIRSTNGQAGVGRPAINEVPTPAELSQSEDEYTYPLERVFVEIHRSDIDDPRHGWRAVIEQVGMRKAPVQIPDDVAAKDLYGVRSVIADVAVLEERQSDGSWVPRSYKLIKIHRIVEGAG